MPILDQLKNQKNKKIIVLGSGALTIGQAGEFDYSGSQAIIALEEEGFEVIIVNPNIATVQTNKKPSRKIYLYPVNRENVEKIIAEERPVAILGGFGGQTALNCLIDLEHNDVLKKYDVMSLGTPVATLVATEDRKIFADQMKSFGLNCLTFKSYTSREEIEKSAENFDYPVIIRSAFALGGLGSGFAKNKAELLTLSSHALAVNPQVMIEKSLAGWKEIEYEVLRDRFGNTICICNMENLDPLGIHTGDSVVVAPSQTINDEEYQLLRNVAIDIVNRFGIVGECNVQFALNPESLEYYVIEINARLSRSSALASKATGFPIAYIAAKVVLGYSLLELKNPVTGVTSAFFEPALDYITIKVPKWDLDKFAGVRRHLDSKMKSVGEVMAIGRTFIEAFQKAGRMILEKSEGFLHSPFENVSDQELETELSEPTDKRIYAVFEAFKRDYTVDEIFELTKINHWFLCQIREISDEYKRMKKSSDSLETLGYDQLLIWKKLGMSDRQIAKLVLAKGENLNKNDIDSLEIKVAKLRTELKVTPAIKKIDTVAAEFPAVSNYLYLTYHGVSHDIEPADRTKPSVLLLGSGPYRIGSSVEFDWCGVSASDYLKNNNYRSLVLNCNPETVSTDYNTSDRLYFDEINAETVSFINSFENPKGVVICFGGQLPNNLAPFLKKLNIPVVGHSYETIEKAEDREFFSSVLDQLKVMQPLWTSVKTDEEITQFVKAVGFPILIRPSFVLSGTAMKVCYDQESLDYFVHSARTMSLDASMVLSKYFVDSMEFELDGVASDGELIYAVSSRHIENAGVHSGDATLIVPVEAQYQQVSDQVHAIGKKIVRELSMNGPFNIQFIVKGSDVMVIECNARASRSFPFISKVANLNLAELALKSALTKSKTIPEVAKISRIGVKAAMFSFNRLEGVDPILGVEMVSTGEVGCVGANYHEVLLRALEATGIKAPKKGVLFSNGPQSEKQKYNSAVAVLGQLNVPIYATEGSADYLEAQGVKCFKITQKEIDQNVLVHLFNNKLIDLVINIPKNNKETEKFNNRQIRQSASAINCSLMTNSEKAVEFLKGLAQRVGSKAERQPLELL